MGEQIKIGTEGCSVQKVMKVLKKSESFLLFYDKWQDFADELHIERIAIKELDEKRKGDLTYKIQHIVRDVLELWVSKEGSRATLDQLLKALQAVKLVALKDRLNEVLMLLKKASTDTVPEVPLMEPKQQFNKYSMDFKTVSFVKNEVNIEDFLCSVCLLIPEAEVYQCSGGHMLCRKCYFQTTKCSECQNPLDQDNLLRNIPIEKILDRMKFECSFKSNGCRRKLSRKNAQNHKNDCCFNFEKFGDFVNLCKSIGYQCDFKFNNGSTKEAIEHFVSKHGCILTTSEKFQMELTSFKESAKAKGSGFYFWTPIIADLNEQKCYLLTLVILAKVDSCFNWLSIFLPYPNNECRGSSPVEVDYSMETGVSFRVWIERPMLLKKTSKIVPTEVEFLNYSLSFVRLCSKEGSLLIDCHIRRLGVAVLTEIERRSFVCARNAHFNSDDIQPQPPKVLVRFDRFSGSAAGMIFRDKLKQNCKINRCNLWPSILNIFDEENQEGLTEEDVKWLQTELIFVIAEYGSVEALEYLIGESVNFNVVDKAGIPLLSYTMFDKNKKIGLGKAKLVVNSGLADVKALSDKEWSALHFAAKNGNNEAVEYFIREGCDVNAINKNGYTPLHLAVLHNSAEEEMKIVKSLLEKGADVSVKTNNRETALDIATTEGKAKIAQLLRSYKSKTFTYIKVLISVFVCWLVCLFLFPPPKKSK